MRSSISLIFCSVLLALYQNTVVEGYLSFHSAGSATKFLQRSRSTTSSNSRKVLPCYRCGKIVISRLHVTSLEPTDTEGSVSKPFEGDISELPNDFGDAVDRAARATANVIKTGSMRCRIDFDTTVGDQTYTSLKSTLPFIKQLVIRLNALLELSNPDILKPAVEKDEEETKLIAEATSDSTGQQPGSEMIPANIVDEAAKNSMTASEVPQPRATKPKKRKTEIDNIQASLKLDRTLRIFFPDMGAAALARRDWKMGTWEAEVPQAVFVGNIQNDLVNPDQAPENFSFEPIPTPAVVESAENDLLEGEEMVEVIKKVKPRSETGDQLAILLCPLYSEADSVKRVLDMCDEQGVPVLMINPELINMDQGFGVRARNMRKTVLDTFTMTYKLKTLALGAVVREWPAGFTIWAEDESVEGGYTLLGSPFRSDPDRETINDLFEEAGIVLNEDGTRAERTTKDGVRNGNAKDNALLQSVNGIVGFFQGMSRL